MKDVPEDELFSAYLDGELTADEQARVEHLLATSPESRQLIECLKSLSATVQSLPVHKLDEDLSQSVLRLAERRMLSESPAVASRADGGAPPESGLSSLPAPHDPLASDDFHWRFSLRRLLRPRNLIFPAAAVAIALLLAVTERFGENRPGAPRVALAPSAASRAEEGRADRESAATEQPVIGPMKRAVPSEAANVATADPFTNRSAGEVVPADGKPGGPPLSSSAANTNMAINAAPSVAAKAPAPAMIPGMMAPGAPPAEETDPAARRSNLPLAGRPMKSAPEKLSENDRKLKEATSDKPAPVASEPALVVRCDVTNAAAARELLEQLLNKQQVALKDSKDSDSRPHVAMGGGVRKGAADAQQFEVVISPAELRKALGKLKTHTNLFASYSLEPQPAPTALDSTTLERASPRRTKKNAMAEESRIASEPPPSFKGDTLGAPTRSRSTNLRAGQGGQMSPEPFGSMQDHFSRGTSQRPIFSQRAQQVTPLPMGPEETFNLSQSRGQAAPADRGGRAGGVPSETKSQKASSELEQVPSEKQDSLAAQALPEEVKQRVVFVLRVTAPEADRLAGPEKAKAAKKAEAATTVAAPAKPAASASPAAAAPASPASPK